MGDGHQVLGFPRTGWSSLINGMCHELITLLIEQCRHQPVVTQRGQQHLKMF